MRIYLRPLDGSESREVNVPETALNAAILCDEFGRHYIYMRFEHDIPMFEQVQVADIITGIPRPPETLENLRDLVDGRSGRVVATGSLGPAAQQVPKDGPLSELVERRRKAISDAVTAAKDETK